MEKLDFEYSISHFFHDLYQIRQQTFPIPTIKSAFKKAGMWPTSLRQVKKNMAKYVRYSVVTETIQQAEPELPTLPRTPGAVSYLQVH
jgi:hypothetical protein